MSVRSIVRRLAVAASAVLCVLGGVSASSAAYRFHGPEAISLPVSDLGDLAVGDVDGDGIPEIATFGGDRRVHVFQRVVGAWHEVYSSSSGAGVSSPANETPTVRYTNEPAIGPGAGFHAGQFLFNAQAPGVIVVSIRLDTNGTWSEQVLFGPMGFIAGNGAFSPPALLNAEKIPTPAWRVIVPGGDFFDPPMHAYLPRFGQAAPYAHMDYSTGPIGYCEEASSRVPDSRIGDFDGNGTNEVALLRYNKLFVTKTDTATTGGNINCWPYQVTALPSNGGHLQMVGGRLNGDATTDLVIRDGDGTLTSLLATPGSSSPYAFQIGTLTSAVPSPKTSTDLGVADLNGDGALDLVQSFSDPKGVEILLNNGSGGFTPSFLPLDISEGAVSQVAIGDMDNDGKLDLVLAEPDAQPARLLILPGRGDGTFGASAGLALGTLDPSALAVTDLDGDNVLDVIVGGLDSDLGDGPQPMLVFHGAGGSAFDPPTAVSGPFVNTSAGLRRMLPFRRSPDDALGIAAMQITGEHESVGDGDGTLEPLSQTYFTLTSTMTGLDRADMNGDDIVDRIRLEALQDGTSLVTIDNGDQVSVALPNTQSGVRAVDWDGDGKLDLVTLNHDLNQIEVRLMDAGGNFTFSAPLTYPLGAAALDAYQNRGTAFVVMPFDASSTFRVLLVREVDSGTSHNVLQVVRNQAPNVSTIYDVGASPGGLPIGIAAADVDGDAIDDVVVGEVSNFVNESFVTVLRGLTTDAFEPNATFVLLGTTLNDLALGDVTGDGEIDLLAVTDASLTTASPVRAPAARVQSSGGEFLVVRARDVPTVTASVGGPPLPLHAVAMALAPNPARGGVERVSFSLPATARVTGDLIDLSGRRVRRVLDAERGAGPHTEGFSISDGAGHALTPGVYFLKLNMGRVSATRRLVVVR